MITNFFLEFTIGIVKREKKLFWLVVLVGGGIEDDIFLDTKIFVGFCGGF